MNKRLKAMTGLSMEQAREYLEDRDHWAWFMGYGDGRAVLAQSHWDGWRDRAVFKWVQGPMEIGIAKWWVCNQVENPGQARLVVPPGWRDASPIAGGV